MLHIFRKYQRYIFIVITVVVIMSFSFFGTYRTLDSNPNVWREQVAFKAINGEEVTRLELDEMAYFLSTDAEDKMQYGGVWGPNFLNDGVIRKDFLETGMAKQLAVAYQEDLREDFEKRFNKEKAFKLYTHPEAHFLGTEHVWSYFAPEMIENYRNLRTTNDPLDPHSFQNRIDLFLLEKKIPSSSLRYILKYQEKQYSWLRPDPRLDQMDLALFGYHSVEDWFGPQFVKLLSEFIINASILAEKQGYEVSRAETLADLIRNTQISYQQNLNNPSLGVTSPEQYLTEQLRRMNMDLGRAVKIWRQVLLFRRYFQDAGDVALVDPLVSRKIHQHGYETVDIDLYQMSPEFRLSNFEDLLNFESYLFAVTKQNPQDPLIIPTTFLPVNKVSAKYPELVQKRYVLEITEADQKTLKAKIGLRELWAWELEEQNWEMLKKEFPVLAVKDDETREERFEILDNLDSTTRAKIDAFAKEEMIKAHPEWIHHALDNTPSQKIALGIRMEGGKLPVTGLDNKDARKAFIELLDQAQLGTIPHSDSPLHNFSADQRNFYRITVLERGDEPEILTFAEAQKDNTMNTITKRILEKYYLANRTKTPEIYRTSEAEGWKPFAEVRESVAKQYYAKLLSALEGVAKEASQNMDKNITSDKLATLRFYPYLKTIRDSIETDYANEENWVKQSRKDLDSSLANRASLNEQWKIEKISKSLNRQSREEQVDLEEALASSPEALSPIKIPSNGNIAFYLTKAKGEDHIKKELIAGQVKQVQQLLSDEIQRHLMEDVLKELKSKGALSLSYLKTPETEVESTQETVSVD